MRIYKFDGNTTTSAEGMQHVAEFIHKNEPKVIIMSATENIRVQLSEITNKLYASDIEGAHNRITKLQFQCLDLVNQLLSDEVIRQKAIRHIINCFQRIWEYCRKPSLKVNKSEIMEQGEVLTCILTGTYLQEKNIDNTILLAPDFIHIKKDKRIDMEQTSLSLLHLFKAYPEKQLFVIQRLTYNSIQPYANKTFNISKHFLSSPNIFRVFIQHLGKKKKG